ncbi:GNAT family N-acetyltransferase [Bacteroidota bacterium]
MQIAIAEYLIRSYIKEDKNSLLKYASNYNISKYLRDSFPHPYSEKDADRWIIAALYQNPELNFAIATNNELIGGIGITQQQDIYRYSAEIGYWLAEPFWGKGIATKSVKAMTEYVFNNFKINRLFAGVFEGNEASERVLGKAGYKLEGISSKAVYKEDKFLDQKMYGIVNEQFDIKTE